MTWQEYSTDVDFSPSGRVVLTVRAGETLSQSFDVSINMEDINEDDEDFTIEILSSDEYELGKFPSTTVTILGNAISLNSKCLLIGHTMSADSISCRTMYIYIVGTQSISLLKLVYFCDKGVCLYGSL